MIKTQKKNIQKIKIKTTGSFTNYQLFKHNKNKR